MRVGHDSWIGHGAVIMKGVTVGNGAIIGAKSVVTKDVPAYGVFAGAPAALVKWRHPRSIAERLEALAWWNWSHEQLRLALPDFRALSADAFLDKYERAAPVMQPLQSVG